MPSIKKFYFFYIILLLIVLIAIAVNPLAFQKSNSIVESASLVDIKFSGKALDVKKFISSIPYKPINQLTFLVHPAALYEQTIVKGYYGCAEINFAIAYYLRKHNVEYQIVHILSKKHFLKTYPQTMGHTVMRTHYLFNGKIYSGIIDVSEGGIPCSGDRFLDVADLKTGSISNFSILSFNPYHDDESVYYDSFLDDSVLGYIYAEDMDRYFHFIETIYIPLGNKKIETYIYKPLAILINFYPKIYVENMSNLFDGQQFKRSFFIFCAWILRSAIFLIPLIVIYEIKAHLHGKHPILFC